jgi:hypothetical protein
MPAFLIRNEAELWLDALFCISNESVAEVADSLLRLSNDERFLLLADDLLRRDRIYGHAACLLSDSYLCFHH